VVEGSDVSPSCGVELDVAHWKGRCSQLENEVGLCGLTKLLTSNLGLKLLCWLLIIQLHALKEQAVQTYARAEAEEECLINKMMKRLNELKKEKETLAVEVSCPPWCPFYVRGALTWALSPCQVEREEELLTNTLQRRLREVLKEKVRYRVGSISTWSV
jgi:hypothetical protein